MSNANDNANLDALLEMSLDDLADLPEFKVYPAGTHSCTMVLERKMIGTHPAIEAKFKMLSTLELADPTEVAPEGGTESSVAFMLDNEFGQGNFKKFMAPLSAHFGTSRVAEILEQSKNLEVVITTKTRMNKDKTQTYLEVTNLQIA